MINEQLTKKTRRKRFLRRFKAHIIEPVDSGGGGLGRLKMYGANRPKFFLKNFFKFLKFLKFMF